MTLSRSHIGSLAEKAAPQRSSSMNSLSTLFPLLLLFCGAPYWLNPTRSYQAWEPADTVHRDREEGEEGWRGGVQGHRRRHSTCLSMRKTKSNKELQGRENAKESHSANMKPTKMWSDVVKYTGKRIYLNLFLKDKRVVALEPQRKKSNHNILLHAAIKPTSSFCFSKSNLRITIWISECTVSAILISQ